MASYWTLSSLKIQIPIAILCAESGSFSCSLSYIKFVPQKGEYKNLRQENEESSNFLQSCSQHSFMSTKDKLNLTINGIPHFQLSIVDCQLIHLLLHQLKFFIYYLWSAE